MTAEAHIDVEWLTFTAGEVAKITGFSQILQRVWRRRGHLPDVQDGRFARFTSLELAELFVRHQLALYCVSPAKTEELGRRAAKAVLWRAILNCDGACEVIGEAESVNDFMRKFDDDDRLADAIIGDPQLFRFLWSAEGSEFREAADTSEFTSVRSYISLVCIDLEAMADRLARGAGRPLLRVTIPHGLGQKTVRRLTREKSTTA